MAVCGSTDDRHGIVLAKSDKSKKAGVKTGMVNWEAHWLDVTGSRRICGDAMSIAEKIQRSVREELGLTVSIGVSYNKTFAKLGSDMKKPDAITEIRSDTFKD